MSSFSGAGSQLWYDYQSPREEVLRGLQSLARSAIKSGQEETEAIAGVSNLHQANQLSGTQVEMPQNTVCTKPCSFPSKYTSDCTFFCGLFKGKSTQATAGKAHFWEQFVVYFLFILHKSGQTTSFSATFSNCTGTTGQNARQPRDPGLLRLGNHLIMLLVLIQARHTTGNAYKREDELLSNNIHKYISTVAIKPSAHFKYCEYSNHHTVKVNQPKLKLVLSLQTLCRPFHQSGVENKRGDATVICCMSFMYSLFFKVQHRRVSSF